MAKWADRLLTSIPCLFTLVFCLSSISLFVYPCFLLDINFLFVYPCFLLVINFFVCLPLFLAGHQFLCLFILFCLSGGPIAKKWIFGANKTYFWNLTMFQQWPGNVVNLSCNQTSNLCVCSAFKVKIIDQLCSLGCFDSLSVRCTTFIVNL